ncbi:MAG: M23 family metallopeptidase, partial [Bacteroides sp.]
ADESKKLWIDRYLSVSYPLQRIRITSPYGYRKDPFTGKRKFHGGIDLHARGEQVLAMMEGVVVKVGQDKTSGKYVTLRHGNYTVSYCHLSRVLAAKGTVVRPRDAVGITGSTGRSTGEHLHVTCKLNGKNINPSVLFDYIKSMQQECVSALAGLL